MNFMNQEARVDESFGRRKFSVTMEERIKDYEKKILCRSCCPDTLPMFFLSENGLEKAYYDFTDYLQLNDYIKKLRVSEGVRKDFNPVRAALDLTARVLVNLKDMESYLLFPERAAIDPDLIFVNPAGGAIRFAYYPEEKPGLGLQEKILRLIDTMNESFDNTEATVYFQRFKEQVVMNNPGLDGMIRNLGILQREASYVYWNPNELRRPFEGSARSNLEKEEGPHNKKSWRKLAAIHGVLALSLAGIFAAGILDILQFAGLLFVAAAGDLLIVRRIRSY